MDYTVHGILQARILELVAFSFYKGSSNPWIEPRSLALQADSVPWATREALERLGVKGSHIFSWSIAVYLWGKFFLGSKARNEFIWVLKKNRSEKDNYDTVIMFVLCGGDWWGVGEHVLRTQCSKFVMWLTVGRFVVGVQSLSPIWLFVTTWTVVCQTFLSFTISWSLLRFTCIESVMLSNHEPLSSPSPFAFNLSHHQGLFQWAGSSHLVAKVLELQLQHQSSQWIFRVDSL